MLLNHKMKLVQKALNAENVHKLKYPVHMPSNHKTETDMMPSVINLRKDIEQDKLNHENIKKYVGGSIFYRKPMDTKMRLYRQELLNKRLQNASKLHNIRVDNKYFKPNEEVQYYKNFNSENKKNFDKISGIFAQLVTNLKNNSYNNCKSTIFSCV